MGLWMRVRPDVSEPLPTTVYQAWAAHWQDPRPREHNGDRKTPTEPDLGLGLA